MGATLPLAADRGQPDSCGTKGTKTVIAHLRVRARAVVIPHAKPRECLLLLEGDLDLMPEHTQIALGSVHAVKLTRCEAKHSCDLKRNMVTL
eukprot:6177245-Pleurochrysis_carterae.AAC.5